MTIRDVEFDETITKDQVTGDSNCKIIEMCFEDDENELKRELE